MGSLLRPGLWTPPHKPPGGGRINWTHPYARGLLGAWTFAAGVEDLVSRLVPSLFSQTTPDGLVETPAGKGLDGVTGHGGNLAAPSSAWTPTDGVTVFWRGTFAAQTSGSLGPATGLLATFQPSTPTTASYGWAVGIIDGHAGPQGNLTGFYDNNGTQVVVDGGIAPTNQPVTMALTIGNGLMSFYVNGRVVSGPTATGIITYSGSGETITFGGRPQLSPVFGGVTTEAYFWARALTAVEIAGLSLNPYAFLAPQPSGLRYLFTGTAGGITAPGAPTAVTAVAGDTLATVSWTPPASNGGAVITSYTVTASPGGATASSASSPVTVTGLSNGTAYTFTVTATNSAGTSAASSPSGSVTPAGLPIAIFYRVAQVGDGATFSFTQTGSAGALELELEEWGGFDAGTIGRDIAASAPNPPGLTASINPGTPSTAVQLVKAALAVGGTGVPSGGTTPLITGDNSDLEGGIGDWNNSNTGGCTVAQSTGWAHSGTHSLQLTSTAAGTIYAYIPASGGFAVTPGQNLTLSAWERSATTTRNAVVWANFYDGSFTFIGGSPFTGFATSTTVDTQLTDPVTVPAGAVYAAFGVQVAGVAGAGEVFNFDVMRMDLAAAGTAAAPTWTTKAMLADSGFLAGVLATANKVTSAVASLNPITVTWPAGTNPATMVAATFGVNIPAPPAAPTVASLTPATGAAAGGTTVVIAGTSLTTVTAVQFGAVAATRFTVDSATQITATSPAGTGVVDVQVTNPSGVSPTGAGDQFTYIAVALPAITGIAPLTGPTSGATTVAVTGTGFTGATAVAFGTRPAAGFTVVSSTQITAVAPSGAAGTVDIRVTTPSGVTPVVVADRYTYTAPVVIAPSPFTGTNGRWQFLVVTTTGSGLAEITSAKSRKVTFDLYKGASAGFTINGLDPQAAIPVEIAADLVCLRDGRRLFLGRLGATDDTLDGTSHQTTFAAVDYRGMLDRRIIWPGSRTIFSQVDQRDIAWQLITDTQGLGSLGIITGSTPTGVLRDRTYNEGDTVGQLITDLSLVIGGFDWEVDAYKSFNVFYPLRGRPAGAGAVLAYGGNVAKVTRTIDTSTFANAVRYSGATGVTPATAVATPGPEGRWEKQVGDTTVVLASTLTEKAAYELALDSTILPSYAVTLTGGWWTPDQVWLGDYVTLVVKSGRLNITATLRVVTVDVTVDDTGHEVVTLTLGQSLGSFFDKLAKYTQRFQNLERR